VVGAIAPIAQRLRALEADPAAVDAVLARGSERARAIAAPVLAEVRETVGFVG